MPIFNKCFFASRFSEKIYKYNNLSSHTHEFPTKASKHNLERKNHFIKILNINSDSDLGKLFFSGNEIFNYNEQNFLLNIVAILYVNKIKSSFTDMVSA